MFRWRRWVQPLPHFPSRLEEWNILLFNGDMSARARIAACARGSLPYREHTKAAYFNAVAARHCLSDRIERGVHDVLNVVMTEIRVLLGEPLYEIGFKHLCRKRRGLGR
jgi:hypothetical protein